MRKKYAENPIPIWERAVLTMEETSAYSGIGERKLRYLTNEPDCDYVIWVGNRKMVNRRKLDEFLEKSKTI